MKPTRTLLDCARTISGSSSPVEAAPTMAAPRERTRRRVVMDAPSLWFVAAVILLAGGRPAPHGFPSAGGSAQLEALDLAGRRLGQLGHEGDPARVLEGRKPRLHVRLQVFRA